MIDSSFSALKDQPPGTPEVTTTTNGRSNFTAKSSRRKSKEHDAQRSSKIRRRLKIGSPVSKKPRIEKPCGLSAITSISSVFEPETLNSSSASKVSDSVVTFKYGSTDGITDEALRRIPHDESMIMEIHLQHTGVREGMQVGKGWSISDLKRRLVHKRYFDSSQPPSLGRIVYSSEDSCLRSFVAMDDSVALASLDLGTTLVAMVIEPSPE